MKYGYALFLAMMGIMFFTFSLNIFKNGILGQSGQFPVVVIFAVISFFAVLLSGIEIGEQKKDKPNYEPIRFEELEPGIYLFMTTPVQHINCSTTGECSLYFMFLEYNRNGKTVPVVVGISAKIEIQDAMHGKFINQIKSGEGLEIEKNHNVTKIET